MADAHTRTRLAWLEQVQDDHALLPSAFTVAFAISRHLNRRTGHAFPGRDALATMTGLSVRQITEHVQSLRDRGHLAVQRRRNQSTIYRLNMPQDVRETALPDVRQTAVPEDQDVRPAAARMCGPPQIGMCGVPQTNPLKEPSEKEPFEGEHANNDLFGGSPEVRQAVAVATKAKAAKPRGSRLVPPDWIPPDDAYEFGARLGLTTEEVERETAKFRDHEFKNAHTHWTMAWRNWIRRGAESRAQRRQPQGSSALDLAKSIIGDDYP